MQKTQNESLPINQKFALSFEECSEYFGVGINSMRKICRDDPSASQFTCKVGAKTIIIRERFEKYMLEHHYLVG